MGSAHLLLCLCLAQLWGQIYSNTTLAESTPLELPTTAATTTKAPPSNAEGFKATDQDIPVFSGDGPITHTVSPRESGTQYDFTPFTVFGNASSTGVNSTGVNITAATAPSNAEGFKATDQDEMSITLQWNKVSDNVSYNLQYGGENKDIPAFSGVGPITHTVSPLQSGTQYDFTLFTVFGNASSTGVNITAATDPSNAEGFKATDQNETSITLQWNKVSDTVSYNLQYGGENKDIPAFSGDGPITHTVSPLQSGTQYDFTLFTVFGNASSTGVNITAATAPSNAEGFKATDQNETSITLQWNKVSDTVSYNLQYGGENKDIPAFSGVGPITHTVSPLQSGTQYDFTLFTVFGNASSTGVNITAVTDPSNAEGFKATDQNETSITLQWNKVSDTVSYNLQYGGENKDIPAFSGVGPITHTVSPLQSGTQYDFTLFTVFGNASSTGVNITAATAPSNAEGFKATDQNETSITLQWKKVSDNVSYNLQYGGENKDIPAFSGVGLITHTVSPLQSGTQYDFTLFTVFGNASSTGVNITAATAPSNAEGFKARDQNLTSITLQWNKVSDAASYKLQYGGESKDIPACSGDGPITHTVSQLESGTQYEFTLFTVFRNISSTGVNIFAATALDQVQSVAVSGQDETSISLTWYQVDNITTYRLQYEDKTEDIDAPNGTSPVEYRVLNLTAGTQYDFTLFAVFKNASSAGYDFTAVTAPLQVAQVTVEERDVTSITLQWNKVDENSNYTLLINTETRPILKGSPPSAVMTYRVSPLKAGTEYVFTLFAVFHGVQSRGITNFTLTAIDCANSDWHVTNSSIRGTIEGSFSEATATATDGYYNGSSADGKVLFTDLLPGSTYNVSLWFINNQRSFLQCQHSLTIVPPDLKVYCDYWAAGYGISLRWAAPKGVWTGVEVNVTGKTPQRVEGSGVLETEIPGLQPAQTYEVSVASRSGNRRSNTSFLDCTTDPRGVIAGSVMAVLLFCLLVCLAVFIVRRRPDLLRKKTYVGNSKLACDKYRVIPVGTFSDHFYQLSIDQQRGFSEEYEDFIPVGREQTRKAAMIPENKSKNRFANVHPYDWSRVKLTAVNRGTSDYINANYLPGYSRHKQYIAAQGPLPNTMDDFWRMIWEQRVKGVVMVTNCTEGGRPKCAQYWPLDYTPCLYGDLLVTVRSEQRTQNWTLREFGVKNGETSEERTVKHFHFTSWPDHGVPEGTEALIHFRGLVRQHVESEGGGTPTVVHCSAGVGRTGTIIALDVLLQQLEREKAVGIAAFVHKMRLSRPLMVQTESQYIFLHQCIMDILENTELIYENADMIYANATALNDFPQANTIV